MEQFECDLRDHLISRMQDNPSLGQDDLMKIASGFVANAVLPGSDYPADRWASQDEQDPVQSLSASTAHKEIVASPTDLANATDTGVPDPLRHDKNVPTEASEPDTDDTDESGEANEARSSNATGFPPSGRVGTDIDKEIIQRRFKNLEHGDLNEVHAIVLHRTDTSAANSVLNSYGAGQRTGAHFLIGTDGTIYQTADLTRRTYHVGNIHRRCEVDDSCTDADDERFEDIKNKVGGIKDKKSRNRQRLLLETQSEYQTKDYPERYPYNGDSIGVEVVGKFDSETGEYDSPTRAQLDSVRKLTTALQRKYGLSNKDVYTHGGISYKMPAEGSGLGYD